MESLVLTDSFSGSENKSPHNPLSTSLPFAEITTNDDPLSQNPNSSSFNSFLEPPSYADAIFRSFDGDHAGEINGQGSFGESLSLTSPSSSSEYLSISVSDPQTEQDISNSLIPGGNSYLTYLITTWTNLLEFGGSEFSIRRRFKDVVMLLDRLSETCRGFFIPIRPDKNVVDGQVMQKNEFVVQRRVALEKYLKRLVLHPVIKKSDELRLFLQVQGKLPLVKTTDMASRMLDGAVKLPWQLFGESVAGADPSEMVQPAKGGRDL